MKRRFKPIRWSGDKDKYFGPFTYCNSDYRGGALMLGSGGGEDSTAQCRLRIKVCGRTLIVVLPPIIRPFKKWVDTSKYEWSNNPRGGYWDIHEREYGFTYSEKSLHVHYGAQTNEWPGSKNKVFFIPWLDWRHVRTSYYGVHGQHFYTEPRGVKMLAPEYDEVRKWQEACPSVKFAFIDHDGARIEATTTIEEREWLRGTGKFKWLSLFYKPKVRRSLNLKFSAEVGPEKGSWKGGTTGHGIEMLPGELHEAAFKRYCEQEHRSKYRPFKIQYAERLAA